MRSALANDLWESATWDGAARATLFAGARASMAERLAWLEEAGEVARRLAESRARRGHGATDREPRAPCPSP